MTVPGSTIHRRCPECNQPGHGRIHYAQPEQPATRGDFLKALAVACLLAFATWVAIHVVAAAALPVPS